MKFEKDDKPGWAVLCEHYVSRHPSKADAILHQKAIQGKQCKADHYVGVTVEPTGTRHYE